MPNRFQRTVSLFLSAVLIFTAGAALAAEPKNANLFGVTLSYNDPEKEAEKQVSSAASLGDVLYVLTDKSVEKWSPDLAAPETVQENVRNYPYYSDEEAAQGVPTIYTRLFSDGAFVYGLDLYSGKVARLTDETGAYKPTEQCTLDIKAFKPSDGGDETGGYDVPQTMDVDVVNGILYITAINYGQGSQSPEIFTWDLATGKAADDLSGKKITGLAPYKDGLMLGVVFDYENGWDSDRQKYKPTSLCTFDPATKEVAILFELPGDNICGLEYQASNDTAYYASDARVYSLPGVQLPAKLSAYLPVSGWNGDAFGLLGGSMYFQANYSGLAVRGLDMPGLEAGALVVYGGYDTRAHNAFMSAHPEIPVTTSNNYYDTLEAFTSAMVSGENAVDVLNLNTNYSPLQRLIDKGYAMDLSGSEKLADAVASMYPAVAEACKKDGKLYALPLSIDGRVIVIENDIWTELGFTKEDMPKTVMDLLDFVDLWAQDYAEEYPDYKLFDSGAAQGALLDYVLENYVAYQKQQKQTLDFDTPLFQKLMKRLDAIDFAILDADVDTDDEEFWNKKTVLQNYMSAFNFYGDPEETVVLPLPLDEGLEPVIPCNLTVVTVNPRTPRAPQALSYLEQYLAFYDEGSANVCLFPDHNEPVENPGFETQLQDWQKSMDSAKARLETASPEEKAGVQSEIDYLAELLANSDRYKFMVTAKQIENYRENIAPYICVVGQTPLTTWDKDGRNDLYALLEQYKQKALTVDQFVKEAAKRVRMMALEDQ